MRFDPAKIDVLVLCGGQGTRLRKILRHRPKVMAFFGGEPFLNLVLNYMRSFGFRRFILGTGFRADAIRRYYSKNRQLGRGIVFSHENKPLGTGGGVKNAQRLIRSKLFFVLNGDSFIRFNPLNLYSFHRQKRALATILLMPHKGNQDYGCVKINRSGKVLSFLEKKKGAAGLINAGVYLFQKEIFSLMPEGKFSLEYNFFPQLQKKGFYGYLQRGMFIDIGTPERYLRAKKLLAQQMIGV